MTMAAMPIEASLQAVLAQVRHFPTLPVILDKIVDLIARDDTTARDIEAVVQHDQVLTAKILSLVNSAFYGFPQQVTTIARAVGVLGFEALHNLALSTSVMQLFSAEASPTFEPVEFWKHSIGTALAARDISRHLGEKQVEEFFVAGLLHDIGKLVHHEFLSEGFSRAGALVQERDILLRTAEQDVLGFTHDQTGRALLTHWRLPRRLIAMVAWHHEPSQAREFEREAAVIQLADILCRAKGLGSGGDRKMPALERAAWEALQLSVGDIEQVMRRTEQEFALAVAVLTV